MFHNIGNIAEQEQVKKRTKKKNLLILIVFSPVETHIRLKGNIFIVYSRYDTQYTF